MRQKMRYFLLFVGLLLSVSIGAQTVKWRDIYTVKKKDTIFGIANKYGLRETLPTSGIIDFSKKANTLSILFLLQWATPRYNQE